MEEITETKHLRVENGQSGDRLDRWLTGVCPDLSRSVARKLIDADDVQVDGRAVRPSHRVSEGERVSVRFSEPKSLDLVAEDVPLDIPFEDEWLLIVSKPIGMTVHPSGPIRTGTLVNALLGHSGLSSVNGDLRPGIVHRLDKDTSGLLVVAKDDVTHRALSAQLEERKIHRQYLAVCWGHPSENEGTIETMIDRSRRERTKMTVSRKGRKAVTHYCVGARYDFLSRLDVTLETGRTHQIRVHLDYIGHPVFGDPVYNGGAKRLKGISPLYRSEAARLLKPIDRQMLHAQRLVFDHPTTGEALEFEAAPPADMVSLIQSVEAASTQ